MSLTSESESHVVENILEIAPNFVMIENLECFQQLKQKVSSLEAKIETLEEQNKRVVSHTRLDFLYPFLFAVFVVITDLPHWLCPFEDSFTGTLSYLLWGLLIYWFGHHVFTATVFGSDAMGEPCDLQSTLRRASGSVMRLLGAEDTDEQKPKQNKDDKDDSEGDDPDYVPSSSSSDESDSE